MPFSFLLCLLLVLLLRLVLLMVLMTKACTGDQLVRLLAYVAVIGDSLSPDHHPTLVIVITFPLPVLLMMLMT